MVITLSKTGDTKESVAIAEGVKHTGIRVVAITKNADSHGAGGDMAYSDASQNGVEYEYMLPYSAVFPRAVAHNEFVVTRSLLRQPTGNLPRIC